MGQYQRGGVGRNCFIARSMCHVPLSQALRPLADSPLTPVAGRLPEDLMAGEGQLGVMVLQASHHSPFRDVDVSTKLLHVAFARDFELLRALLHASRRFLYLLPTPTWQHPKHDKRRDREHGDNKKKAQASAREISYHRYRPTLASATFRPSHCSRRRSRICSRKV